MPEDSRKQRDWARTALIAIALVYAFLAGLHTVDDLDLGWHMAAARYALQHHEFVSTTIYNYTAPNSPYRYPPFSGIVFYFVYLLGGYAALSWFRAVACAGTVAILVRGGGKTTAALALLAVPAIMFRENLRPDLFSVVLFAALTTGIWRYYTGQYFRLWLMPVYLLLWANLHPGFVFGFGALAGYVLFELCDLPFTDRREASLGRLRRAAPWILASVPVTLLNPFGWKLYDTVLQQGKLTAFQTAFVSEWSGARFNGQALFQALHPRDPASCDWWFMAIGLATNLIFLWKKQFGPGIFVAALLLVSIQHVRFRAVYAVAVVVFAGAALPQLAEGASRMWAQFQNSREEPSSRRSTAASASAVVVIALFAALASVRVFDLVSNRYYVNSLPMALFGTGLSWWFPERATSFLENNELPGNLFHDFNVGGYLIWRIGEKYPDFSDGRVMPFANGIMDEQKRILGLPPDSNEMKQEADRWNIQTILFSISPYMGLGSVPLPQYCASQNWKLVYMDDVSAIFIRNTPVNQAVIARLGESCDTAKLTPATLVEGASLRAKAERFHFLFNASSIFYVLERDAEAWENLNAAEALFPRAVSVHLLKAQLFEAEKRPKEAESEYLQTVLLDPCDDCWFALARMYVAQNRYAEAEVALKEAAAVSLMPHDRLRSLGQLYVLLNQPQLALSTFARAEDASPYRGAAADQGKRFRAQLAEGRARAFRQLNDLNQAIAQENVAVQLEPEGATHWQVLADLYQVQGQPEKAAEARVKAESLSK
jgi:tetratricopeptide (TPR) repeat protein